MDLIRQLRHADMNALLETPQLKHIFTQYQKDEILSRKVANDRVGKCLDIIETKGNVACQKLADVVEQVCQLTLNPPGHPRSKSLSSSPAESRSPSRKHATALYHDAYIRFYFVQRHRLMNAR